MKFRTIVDIPKANFEIPPCEEMLFVGSCFADNIGQRFEQEQFRVTVNPFGVMYNHIYRLKETNEVVDNCAKRPQSLFREEEMSVDECAEYLLKSINLLRDKNPNVKVILTVSPIRYAKYGFHGSQLSKATLLLAISQVISQSIHSENIIYFPAYEIINDELRDYRFYKEDMLHPSDQAVEYIYQRFSETFFGKETFRFLKEWKPIKEALGHRPFHPDSEEHRLFVKKTWQMIHELALKYPTLPIVTKNKDFET